VERTIVFDGSPLGNAPFEINPPVEDLYEGNPPEGNTPYEYESGGGDGGVNQFDPGRATIEQSTLDDPLWQVGEMQDTPELGEVAPPVFEAEEEQGWIDWLTDFIPFVSGGKKMAGADIEGQQTKNEATRLKLYDDIANGRGDVSGSLRRGRNLGKEGEALRGAVEVYTDFAMTVPGAASTTPGSGRFGAARNAGKTVGEVVSQTHHIATNKGKWGEIFRVLLDRAKIADLLDGAANTMQLPGHAGRHTEKYHQYVFQRLRTAIGNKTGDAARDAATEALNKLRDELTLNPRLPYTDGGLQ
jgi:hypothetical protein